MEEQTPDSRSIDAVVSKAVELLIPESYKADVTYAPKKESEQNLRRFLAIPETASCADCLLQSRTDSSKFKIVDGKATSELEKLPTQLGSTAGALILSGARIRTIESEIFCRIGSIPYGDLRKEFPGIDRSELKKDAGAVNLYAQSVREKLEIVQPNANSVRIGGSAFFGQRHQDAFILVHNAECGPVTPAPVLPNFQALKQTSLRASGTSSKQWNAEKFAAQTGKIVPFIGVRFVQFKSR